MIVVIFEVQPNQAGGPRYFDLAAELRRQGADEILALNTPAS